MVSTVGQWGVRYTDDCGFGHLICNTPLWKISLENNLLYAAILYVALIPLYDLCHAKILTFCAYAKTKAQISCTVNMELIIACVFAA